MPKSLIIDPAIVRQRGSLVTPPIPVNAYGRDLGTGRRQLGDARLSRILRDMLVVREFEQMLDGFKRAGRYEGVSYAHRGPAHLSIGQEAAAVGQAVRLGVDDHIFGSHRSHGEIMAKGLAAIEELDEAPLERMMAAHLDGEPLRLLEANVPAPDVRTRAVQFLLYGLLAEIFGRRTGFNRGLGGSMHAFFPPLGIYPNNAIVGGSAPIATGAALYRRVRGGAGIVVANVGDGSTGAGPVWEAMNFAGMRQLRNLWEQDHRGGLPVLFFFVNNFYAMGGQTGAETMAYDRLARIGAGLNEEAMHAETVDGNDPLAVADAVRRKRLILETGDGPVLLDVQCYRQSGHSTSDASSYRTAEEIEAWRAVDPLREFGDLLESEMVIDAAARRRLAQWARDRVGEVVPLAVDLQRSPRIDLSRDPEAIARLMFSNAPVPADSRGRRKRDRGTLDGVALRVPLEASSRVRQLAVRSRSGRDKTGRPVPSTGAITLRAGLFEAIVDAAARDPEFVIYGEENRDWEGAFGVYQGLTELLPYHRLFNAPVSEAAIVGTAVGYAMEGGRALVELMYADFIGRAGDELLNQLAKWQPMSGGLLRLPVVVRVSVGSKYGAQHSQDWSGLVCGVAGLKVVYPATPYDAKGLMTSALAGSDPVVFFESQLLYDATELFHDGGVPRSSYTVPIGVPDVKRPGRDLTILSVGPALYRALDAADRLAESWQLEAEVIDARSLVPFDYELVISSVRRTSRLILVSDATARGSILNTFAADLSRLAFDSLDAPVIVLGAPNWITPPAEMEDAFFPQVDDLLDVVHEELVPLRGYEPRTAGRRERVLAASRRGA
jgi:2-oxoisovalerate dehydrogenase E1 component